MVRESRSATAAKAEEKDMKSWGSGGLFANRELGSLGLMVLPPLFVYLIWYASTKAGGSMMDTLYTIQKMGVMEFWHKELYPGVYPWDPRAWKILGLYSAFELILMKWVPGKIFKATPTSTGHVPVYVANGVASYFISILALFGLKYFDIFNPADVYDLLGKLLGSIVVAALGLCTVLYYKGLHYPSTKDCGSSGSLIVDFFWGTELYPRIFGWDVKQFTNCRFGMMYWQLGILCYAFKQYDLYGYVSSSMLISIIIQTCYIAKFFYWETGYFCSMDIQHDRAGYYICWGCLCWVPSVYTIHTIYLVEHPMLPSPLETYVLIFCGLLCVWLNYDCDAQRQEFRASGGKTLIWGKKPEYIVAHYTTEDCVARSNLLLTSGYWGLSRHIHYIPEILASVFWCVPIHCDNFIIPYFYPVYLTALLFDRAWRDDKRCSDKYGKYWDQYCELVPEKVIPGVI